MGTLAFILQILLLLSGFLLMIIILLQRGRGGGLAGAFGGAGGQSAFGTKAGDVFTWITVVTATIWVLLAGIGGCAMRSAATSLERSLAPAGEMSAGATPGDATSGDAGDDANAQDNATPEEDAVAPPADTDAEASSTTTPEADGTTPPAPEN